MTAGNEGYREGDRESDRDRDHSPHCDPLELNFFDFFFLNNG